MGRIISSYIKAFGQLSDPKTRSVVWASIGWSLAIFIGLYIALYVVLNFVTLFAIAWLDTLFGFLAQAGILVLTWFLFPPVVTAIGSLMLDKVVEAVEARHYPDRPMAPGVSLAEGIGPALKFLGATVGYNLLLVPLFLVPPFWPLIPFIYLALNGYLLSREYFELVSMRRLTYADATAMRKRWRFPLFIAGIGFAFMLTIPILNLVAPVIATAAVVHLFEAWRTRDKVDEKPVIDQKGGAVAVKPESSPPTEI